jgi:hypothetical protein
MVQEAEANERIERPAGTIPRVIGRRSAFGAIRGA